MTHKASIIVLLTLLHFWVFDAEAIVNAETKAMAILNANHQELLSTDLGSDLVLYKNANSERGFAVVLNDGTDSRVIAYSRNATFDPNSENPGIRWWVNSVKKWSAHSVLKANREITKPDTTRFPANVEPLLTTKWGQREPFKFMCPFNTYIEDTSLYGTYTPDMGHYVVGCVPTAMAQYMNYYKFPVHGIGQDSVEVKYTIDGSNQQVVAVYKVDFENSTYDYSKMIDNYQGEYTDEQAQAVAQLCYHCGVAAQASYTSSGAGSNDVKCLNAFINRFNYCDTAHYIVRSNYSEPQWMEMVYTMLSNRHPIFYSAKDINYEYFIVSGHNFIIDGYDQNGLVHVNWGWYGIEDGYFDIGLLNPQQYSYDDWQAMYIGLYPNENHMAGDANGDGAVDVNDVTTVINHILGKNPQPFIFDNANVNSDNEVNVMDVTLIINIILGIS